MASDRANLLDASLGLAWAHWVGLGVRGVAHPPSTAVDPEALLYFTSCIAKHDPRLRDEVGDWWSQFRRHVSRSRLSALARSFDDSIVTKLDTLLRSFDEEPSASGKSRLDRLDSPARSLLRFRCVFGANARAEVLLELLTRGGESGMTARTLSDVGYSKRNVALVLEELALAGILAPARERNRIHYRILDRGPLASLLRPLPRVSGRWYLRFPILASFIELADRLRDRDAVVQGVEARKLVARLEPKLDSLGLRAARPDAVAETYWSTLQQWLIDHVISDNHGDPHRTMIEGVWLEPGGVELRTRGRQQPTSAIIPRLSADPAREPEFSCLGLVRVPTVERPDWDWAVLSTAATHTYVHTIGLSRGEPWQFATWAFGELRLYSATLEDPVPCEQIEHLYGSEAATRARPDLPALQLRMRRVTESR